MLLAKICNIQYNQFVEKSVRNLKDMVTTMIGKKKILLKVVGFVLAACMILIFLPNFKIDVNAIEVYTIVFMPNNNTQLPPLTGVTKGSTILPPDVSKTEYVLVGWYKDADFQSKWNFATDTVTSNITLWAKWAQKTYSVTFDLGKLSYAIPNKIIDVVKNSKISPPNVDVSGYEITGWYKDVYCQSEWIFNTDVVISDIMLYPQVENVKNIPVSLIPGSIGQLGPVDVKGNGIAGNVTAVITETGSAETGFSGVLNNRGNPVLLSGSYYAFDINIINTGNSGVYIFLNGQSFDVSIPVPAGLQPNIGALKAISIKDGKLDVLPSSTFVNNGVPYISFTSTHNSPYAIVVDTANVITVGGSNPKTGNNNNDMRIVLLLFAASASAIIIIARKSRRDKVVKK